MIAVEKNLSFFERYLIIWVPPGIAAGIALARLSPRVAAMLDALTPYRVLVYIAICVFFMLYFVMKPSKKIYLITD
jgi:ACR3 family arsenite efflux pump ArsB